MPPPTLHAFEEAGGGGGGGVSGPIFVDVLWTGIYSKPFCSDPPLHVVYGPMLALCSTHARGI